MKLIVTPHRYNRGKVDEHGIKPRIEILADVQLVMTEYASYLPITIRQIYYRLIGRFGYPKDSGRKSPLATKLGGLMGDAREGRIIDWDHIRDDGPTITALSYYRDTQHFLDSVIAGIDDYELDPQLGQQARYLVCCEAAGMVPQLENGVCRELGIKVHSSGGFNSKSTQMELAKMIHKSGQRYLVFHPGDHDPAGRDVFKSLKATVQGYVAALNRHHRTLVPKPFFFRVAVTADQIDLMKLTIETKVIKSQNARNFPGARYVGAPGDEFDKNAPYECDTCQLEAIPPNMINRLLKEALTVWKGFDMVKLNEVLVLEEEHKEELRDILRPLLPQLDDDSDDT